MQTYNGKHRLTDDTTRLMYSSFPPNTVAHCEL
jgi:hypothetical protein